MFQEFYNSYAGEIKSNEELKNLSEELQEKLFKTLNEDDLIRFNKYEDVRAEETELLSYESFKHGFRASILLMLEVMQN
jgi:DNA recombination-dependent growth factor C